jgi:hypothetical protein
VRFRIEFAQGNDLPGKGVDVLGEKLSFRRTDPGQTQALPSDAGNVQKRRENIDFLFGLKITILVMTVAEMSTTHKNAVKPPGQSVDHKQGVHPTGTHHPHRTDGRRILESGNPRQVRTGIGTPVTQKA